MLKIHISKINTGQHRKHQQWCPRYNHNHKHKTNTTQSNKQSNNNTEQDLGDHPVNSENHNIRRCLARANSKNDATD